MRAVVRSVLLGFVAATVLTGPVVSAAAAPVTVYDEAGVVDDAAVTAAAAPIADVELVVIAVRDARSLDAELDSRGFGEDDFPANTVVLTVDVGSREVDVAKPDDLSGVDTDAVIDEMIPELRNRNWTDAFVAGMQAVDDQLHPSRTWLWVLLGLVLAAIGWFGARALVRSARRKEEERRAEEARVALIAANATTVVELRRRLDDLAVLILTVADGPARDPLEVKLNDVEVAVRAKEEQTVDLLSRPEVDRDRLAALGVVLDSVTTSLAVLRQDTGWQDRWREQVAAVAAEARELARDQEAVGTADGFVALDVAAAQQQLANLLDPVLTGQLPIVDAVAQLSSLSVALVQKENEADRILDFRREQQRQEQAAERARLDAQEELVWTDDGSADGFWGSSGSGGGYRRTTETSAWSWFGSGSSGSGSSSSGRSRSSSRRSFSSSRSSSRRSSSRSRSSSRRRF